MAKKKLSEAQWEKVFKIRCKSKQGQDLTNEELDLIILARKSDLKRYVSLDEDVFEATRPFGSVKF